MPESRPATHKDWLAHATPFATTLTCVLIALGSLQPFFSGQVPLGADTALHFFRISAWERLWAQGILYTQWMPDFALGYGYPLMNYHPPLAYYLGVVMARLGFSLPHAMLAAWILSAIAATTGMFYWVRSMSRSDVAGIVAAAAYAFAPYTLYNVFTRGGFAESIGISIAPWLFYAIYLYTQRRQLRFGLLLTCCFTAIMLSHVIASLLLAAVALAFIVVGALDSYLRDADRRVSVLWRTILGGCGFFVLALGLAAFFWLPPQFELGLVQIARGTSGYADFSTHFLSLGQLLDPPNAVDPNFVGQYTPSSLSWLTLGLALLALIQVARSGKPAQNVPALALAFIALVAGLMALPVSQVVWERISILRFLQYPFRFLGIATLMVSALAGFGATGRFGLEGLPGHLARLKPRIRVSHHRGVEGFPGASRPAKASNPSEPSSRTRGFTRSSRPAKASNPSEPRARRVNLLLAVIVFVLVAGFATYAYTWQITKPDPLANNPNVTMRDIWQAEQQLGTIGTTSFGEYLPKDVSEMPKTPAITDEQHPDRLDYDSPPTGALVSNAVFGPLAYDMDFQTPAAFTATLRTFYFPGWAATLDGAQVTLTPSVPHGLIQVVIPAGQHHLHVAFGLTPIRLFATLISLLSLLVLASIVVWAILRRWRGPAPQQPGFEQNTRSPLTVEYMAAGALALVLAWGFKTAVVDTRETPFEFTHLHDHQVQGASDNFDVNFGGTMHLIGGNIPRKSVKAGQTLDFALYWQVYQPTQSDFSIKTDVVGEYGIAFGQYDTQHPNGIFPTSRVTTTDYILDERHIAVAADAPPGVYQVKASVYYNGDPGRRLTVLDSQGAPIGTTYEATAISIFTVTVERPDQPAALDQVKPATIVNQVVGNDVVLIGHSLPAQVELHVGDSFSLDTYWRVAQSAAQKPQGDMKVCFELASAAERVTLTCAAPVQGLPTSQWLAGDVWHSAQAMRIPPALAGGTYSLTLKSDADNAVDVPISTLRVSAPERNFELPAQLQSEPNHFKNGIALAGYRAPMQVSVSAGQLLTVSLYWRTDQEIAQRLKVFVQVVDTDGNRIAGSDQVPGAVRPTTDWIQDEYILDVHTLSLPKDMAPGEYKLLIGLYDEGNLQRVLLDDGQNALLLNTPVTFTR